jgi:hypothetical protein
LGTSTTGELSARERRKIAAAEKKFEQLEQDQQHSQKRKKRTAGASTQPTCGVGITVSGLSIRCLSPTCKNSQN